MNKKVKIFLTILLSIMVFAIWFCFFQLFAGLILQDEELIFVYGFSLMGASSACWLIFKIVDILLYIWLKKK